MYYEFSTSPNSLKWKILCPGPIWSGDWDLWNSPKIVVDPRALLTSDTKLSLCDKAFEPSFKDHSFDQSKPFMWPQVWTKHQTDLRKVEWGPRTSPSGSSDDRNPTSWPCPAKRSSSSSSRCPCRRWPSSRSTRSRPRLRIQATCGPLWLKRNKDVGCTSKKKDHLKSHLATGLVVSRSGVSSNL